MRHRVALLLAASFGLSLVYTGSAMAATQWVNDDAAVGTNTSCANPGYNDIQSAVTAANPLDIVRVCPGVYDGGVLIDKRLTVRGAKFGVDARTRNTVGESIVNNGGMATYGFKLDADRATLDGFSIRTVSTGAGVETSPDHSGYLVANNIISNNTFGIYANSADNLQSIIRTNKIFNNNRGFGVASASGNGIYTDQGTNHMFITRNVMTGQKNSGFLFTNTSIVQNDDVTIQFNRAVNNANFVNLFGNNSNFQIRQNTTNDTINSDDANQGSAIRIADNANGVVVANNLIQNQACSGVAVRDAENTIQKPDNIDINFNRILAPGCNGVDVTDSQFGAVSVFRNTIRHAVEDGIFFGDDTQGNFINTNDARFSGILDCEDTSTGTRTAGTANSWSNNIGITADPRAICRRP